MIIKKEREKKYMVIDASQQMDLFATQMILENHIPGLIVCKKETFNGDTCFYYDVTGKTALSDCTEKLKAKSLEHMLSALLSCMDTLDAYFLSSEGISLHPDTIFEDKGEWYFCYFTQLTEEKNDTLSFCEELLTRVDQKDERAVVLVYQLYQAVRKDVDTLHNILNGLLYEDKTEDRFSLFSDEQEAYVSNELKKQSVVQERYPEKTGLLQPRENEDSMKKDSDGKQKADYLTIVIFAILALGSCIMLTIFSLTQPVKSISELFIYRESLLCACFFVLGITGMVGSAYPFLHSKGKEAKPQHVVEEEVFEIPSIDKI